MIRPFLRYYVQWRNDRIRDLRYRYYVTDALKLITENTAKFGGGKYLTNRFADVVSEKKHEKPEHTAKEIADKIIKGLNT